MFQVECQIREAHERNTVPFAQTNVRNGAGYTNEPGLNSGNVRNTAMPSSLSLQHTKGTAVMTGEDICIMIM